MVYEHYDMDPSELDKEGYLYMQLALRMSLFFLSLESQEDNFRTNGTRLEAWISSPEEDRYLLNLRSTSQDRSSYYKEHYHTDIELDIERIHGRLIWLLDRSVKDIRKQGYKIERKER